MKTFLKLSLFLFIGMLLSCSSDDATDNTNVENPEESLSEEEKLLGTWALSDREPYGIEDCERLTTFNFGEENYMEYTLAYGDEASECEEILLIGTWEFLNEKEKQIFIEVNSEDESALTTRTFTYDFVDEETLEVTYEEEFLGVETFKKQ
ncbi:hypothetical protein [Mesonia maritima]|uniref:Lipocalin-like domain-containing protein n=1 Tax=Mesonia maritima TaxID=1793873 RepID=A0ABU1K288_9FLAO|nr:hypothetical protein [Mesonia maritima]MDR6299719.1 hypothetical protein [Mesonia maritima]